MTKYMSGSIVLTKYFNFDKEEVNGVFCVLNDEALDMHTHHNGNVVVVKVTSQLKSVEAYSVFLNSNKNAFLLKDSFAQCNKIHTLNKKAIIECIGVLDADTTNDILDKAILLLKESKRHSKLKGGK